MKVQKVINKLDNNLPNRRSRSIKAAQPRHFKCKKDWYRESHPLYMKTNQGMLRNEIQTSQAHISLENESVDVTET